MRPESHQQLERLIAFNTVSNRSNLELIHYIQDYLKQHGIDSQLIRNSQGDKANLLACIGPAVAGGIVLSGHTDVVPTTGQSWSTDPFVLTEKEGRWYGRGTADMKSFIALALAAVPAWAKAPLQRPIYLAFSYDEEIGCLGAPDLITVLKEQYPTPQAVIVGEPTSMQPVIAHKSITTLKTTVRGFEAHSSQTQRGVSAISLAAQLIQYIDAMRQHNAAHADTTSPFTPPYTTLQTGRIEGGNAVNIIAGQCQFEWDIRCLPDENWQTYLQRFETEAKRLLTPLLEQAPDIHINTEIMAEVPAFHNPQGQAFHLLAQLCPDFRPQSVPFVSEAGQYQAAGFDVVLCGPGAIDQAHQPNEYISQAQLKAAEVFFDRLLHYLCAPTDS